MRKKSVDTYPFLATAIIFALIIILFGPDLIRNRITQAKSDPAPSEATVTQEGRADTDAPAGFAYDAVPDYSGEPWVSVNDGVPYFDPAEISTSSFISLGDIDLLGRCTAACSCLSMDTVPTKDTKRLPLDSVTPSGWVQGRYKYIDDGDDTTDEPGALYNRSHLLAFCLTGIQDDPKGLITGTRYLNVDGMFPWETQVQKYIYDHQNNHVMYRVTPVFLGSELLARGVLMEGYSVEDNGALSFCVYAYNVQPGIDIDYSSGSNMYSGVFLDTDADSVIYYG